MRSRVGDSLAIFMSEKPTIADPLSSFMCSKGRTLHILYLVSAIGNPLYDGRYELHGRYMTFGQHSFILDLITGMAQRGVTVTLAVAGLEQFSLTIPLRRFCRVIDPLEDAAMEDVDLVL